MAITDETPEVIARYLNLATGSDYDGMTKCFTEDATVIDEGETMRGREEIQNWRKNLAATFKYTVTVKNAEQTSGDRYLVTATIEGNFPGSPVDLKYQFALENNLIHVLEIAP